MSGGCENPTWRRAPNGDRTCSYCGSLHPEDFLDIMIKYIEQEPGYRLETTSKPYKIYANRSGVQNASQGGIKFYFNHLVDPEHHELFEGLKPLASAVMARKYQEMMEHLEHRAHKEVDDAGHS